MKLQALDRAILARIATREYERDLVAAGVLDPPPVAGTASQRAPVDGEWTFLVHGECECGWRCACPEGWTWPECPICGNQVLPPRRDGRRGYAALILPEVEALRTSLRYARELGF